MRHSVLGVGIVGAGNIFPNHATAFRCLPKLAKLVAVADIDPSRANAAKRAYDFQYAYPDYRDLLSRTDIDVVSICTPPAWHTSIIIDALAAGKQVLCEKPMARTLADADQVILAAELHPHRKLSFVYQYRADPTHNRVRDLIRNGSMGRVFTATVRVRALRTVAYYAAVPGRGSWASDGGGVLVNQAIHQLDSLISFLGTPVEVSSRMDTFSQPIEAEDTLVGWIRFESGALATFDCTVCAHNDGFYIEVIGENAQTTITGNPSLQYCNWTLDSTSSAVERALRASALRGFPDLPEDPGPSTIFAKKAACKVLGRPWLPPMHWGHTPFVKNFLESIGSAEAAQMAPREARRSLELAVGLYASAMTGKPERLPITCDHPFYNGIPSEESSITTLRAQAR